MSNDDNIVDFERNNVISPYKEMIAYDTLWMRDGATLKKVSSEYLKNIDLPSQALNPIIDQEMEDEVRSYFNNIDINFSIMTTKSYQYPVALKDPKHPIKLLYYRGDIDLLKSPKRVSIVGARKASPEGIARARKIAKELVKEGYVIVSGLAEGIDTAAMTSAIEAKGELIGVIGTPINEYYPKKNKELQEKVARDHLLISHVPIYRYSKEHFNTKRFYFPQRNVTMAAVSDATIIIEASDTSGTLTQARACMEMGRKLFILNSCFENSSLKWPYTYEKRGAIRANNMEDILNGLKDGE